MLSDYFPPRLRATVLGIYSSGIYIGAGIGIFLGGWIVDGWNSAYPDPGLAPFGLRGWQAAYLAVGEALRSSLMLSILSLVVPLVLLLLLLKRLGPAEANRIERARAAGEVIPEDDRCRCSLPTPYSNGTLVVSKEDVCRCLSLY